MMSIMSKRERKSVSLACIWFQPCSIENEKKRHGKRKKVLCVESRARIFAFVAIQLARNEKHHKSKLVEWHANNFHIAQIRFRDIFLFVLFSTVWVDVDFGNSNFQFAHLCFCSGSERIENIKKKCFWIVFTDLNVCVMEFKINLSICRVRLFFQI